VAQTEVVKKVRDALVEASTTVSPEKKTFLRKAIEAEQNLNARWLLGLMLDNAEIAERTARPTCDDTGIPHVILEVGGTRAVSAEMLRSIQQGVAEGLRAVPCRPMAVKGDDVQRLEQSVGLDDDPGALALAPIYIKRVDEDVVRIHLLLQGGGPEIRGRTCRVFHRHKLSVLVDEIVSWAVEAAGLLGCTPCAPAIGIGRTHFEASALMLEAMAFAKFDVQNDMEQEITRRINESCIGPQGLGGNTTALATFLRIGPQRASGVRIVSLRLCCCAEPRVATVEL
jgi:fumarate hydratase subunit alpha